MKKSLGVRMLACLLAVLMTFSLLPSMAFAANGQDTGSVPTDDFYKIVHLDSGRKYFSPDNIKAIIDNAAAAGFNQVELYLSDNQGFRFALDDMTITTSTGNVYDLTPALGDGYSQTDGKCPDGSGKYLTQAEMTDLISYAAGKGIDIVPCINVPGHMGAILEAFPQFKYDDSKSSIDLENAEAVAFALAVTEKYAAYFQSQGVQYYNLGADEYANDLSTMGFQGLYTSGKYQKFVDFLNNAAQIVINRGMTPRAFNDGLYYNEDNTYPVNSAIQVCYWSCGWSGYNLASAQYLVNQGLDVINTHGDYYWVLGNTGWQCSANKAAQFDCTSFQYRDGTTGSSTISNPAGAMFCIWCDVGNTNGADGGSAVVSATAGVIAAFGAAEKSGTAAGVTPVVPVTKTNNGVSVTAPKLTDLTVTDGTNPTIAGATQIKTYHVTPVTASGNYTGSAVVTMPIPEGWTEANVRAFVVNSDNTVTAIKGTVSNGSYCFVAPHFSDAGLYDTTSASGGTEVTESKTITVTVGKTVTDTIANANYEGDVDRSQLDETLATVTVTGKDAVEATEKYNVASVSCNTLISSNSSSWKAVSGYYYKVGDNYYPVYAKRSTSGFIRTSYTYTWGYSTTGSTNNVTQISTQTTTNTRTTPNITVYTKSGTEAVPASTTVTFTGVKVGTTYVTVGNTKYTINVVAEDLSEVTPLEVEYWVTNRPVTANGSTSGTITANAPGVYSESGAKFSDLVPSTGTWSNFSMVFWKGTRLAWNNHQTSGGGVDKTTSGTDFTYIRYWNGSWAYSADGTSWTNVASGDQIVAYYLQKTVVTDEVTTYVADWGEDFPYNITQYVLVDYAVKYESGERVPNAFPINPTTQVFHCAHNDPACDTDNAGNWYRNIGIIKGAETAEYEVYMITLTPTSDSVNTTLTSNANGNRTGQTNFYAGTEKVVWVDDEANLGKFTDESLHYTSISGDITYSVGGEPIVPGIEIYDRHGMLVTYYVRAKVTKDSLTVHYIDASDSMNELEFYRYNIVVKEGTTFNPNIGLANPWKGSLANGSVINSLNETQTVSADLDSLSRLSAQYRYTDYVCTKVERSSDGKEVYLYYKFDPTVYFVADFGLPMNITAADLSDKLSSATIESITFANTSTKFGTLASNASNAVTYTPNQILTNYDFFTLVVKTVNEVEGILDEASSQIAFRVYIIPASNVLYEDGFMTPDTAGSNVKWVGNNSKVNDAASPVQSSKNEAEYGYDTAYASETGISGSVYTVTLDSTNLYSNDLSFTFTGTGFDLIGTCAPNTGTLLVRIDDANGNYVKAYLVDTSYTDDAYSTIYQVPLVHENSLANGTYTVTIYGAYINYNTASAASMATFAMTDDTVSPAAFANSEADPVTQIYELLYTMGLTDEQIDDVQFINMDKLYGAATTYAAEGTPSANAANTAGAVYVELDGFRVYRPTTYNGYVSGEKDVTYYNVLDAVNNDSFTAYIEAKADGTYTTETYEAAGGPQNEIYLAQGQSIGFKVAGSTPVQVSLRNVSGGEGAAVAKIAGSGATAAEKTITHATELYYTVTPSEDGLVTITNTGSGLLAICNFKFATSVSSLSEADYPVMFAMLRYDIEEPVVDPTPEVPVDPIDPEDPVVETFAPEKMDVKISTTNLFFTRIVTVTVSTSSDVSYITVNGEKVKPIPSFGFRNRTRGNTFVYTTTVSTKDEASFEIIAYNADGLASDPQMETVAALKTGIASPARPNGNSKEDRKQTVTGAIRPIGNANDGRRR